MTCENAREDIKKNVGGIPLSQRVKNWTKKREISPESAAEWGMLDGKHNIPKEPVKNASQVIRLITAFSDEKNHETVQDWSKADSPLYQDLAGLREDIQRITKNFHEKRLERKAAKEEHKKRKENRKNLNNIYSIGWLACHLPIVLFSIPEAILSFLTLAGISDNTYALYALAGFMAVIFAFSGHKLGAFARQPFSRRNAVIIAALIIMPITLVIVAAEIRSQAVYQSDLITKFWHGNPPSFLQFLLLFLGINGMIMLLSFALSYCYREHIPELREADANLKIAKDDFEKAQKEYDEVYASLAQKRNAYAVLKARREKLAQIWDEKCKETRDWAIGISATYAAANNLARTDGEEIEFDENLIPTVNIKDYAAEIDRAFEEFPDLEVFPEEELAIAA